MKLTKEQIMGIRTKHLKTDVPDEPLGVLIKPVRARRFPQGSTLQERFIAGDDFVRDVQRLPKKYQDKIEIEIQKLNDLRDQEIQEAKEKRNLQRDRFWATLDKIGKDYEQKKVAIKEFDQYEESDIKTILGKHEVRIVKIRQKYIELSKLPNVDLNSPEADNYEYENETENENKIGKLKNQGPGGAEETKEMDIDVDRLYTQSIIQEKIKNDKDFRVIKEWYNALPQNEKLALTTELISKRCSPDLSGLPKLKTSPLVTKRQLVTQSTQKRSTIKMASPRRFSWLRLQLPWPNRVKISMTYSMKSGLAMVFTELNRFQFESQIWVLSPHFLHGYAPHHHVRLRGAQ
jgi:hypothetical protein